MINPPKMKYINVDFVTKTYGAKNLFTFKF